MTGATPNVLAAVLLRTVAPSGTNDMTSAILDVIGSIRESRDGGTVTLLPGDYCLRSPVDSDVWVSNHDNPRPRRIFLPIVGVTNLTVRCDGMARLVADGEGICVALMDTKNVRFEGVAFDYARPFFSVWRLKGGKLVKDGDEYPCELRGRTIFRAGTCTSSRSASRFFSPARRFAS